MSDSPRRRHSPPPPPEPLAGEGPAPAPRPAHQPPPPPPHGYEPPESLGGPGRPPVWVWPSIVLGLIYPALARSARLDAALIERLPDPPTNLRRLPSPYQTLLVGFVVVVAVFFSLLRGGGTLTTGLGLGFDVVFTESYPFMLLALIIGMLSPSAGLLLVMLHIPLDIVASLGIGSPFGSGQLEPLLTALAGRGVSWWLLWLLAVGIPLMARSIPGATLASGQPRDLFQRTVLAYAAAAVVGGILLWMWTAALPFLVRPVFAWSQLGSPTDQAVQPIQATGHVIIAVGVVLALAMTAIRQRFGVLDEEVHEINQPSGDLGTIGPSGDRAVGHVGDQGDMSDVDDPDEPLFSDQLETIGKIAVQAFAVIALGGMVTGALDVALLFGAAVIGQLAAGRLARWGALATILLRVPWVIRFILAFLITFAFGFVVNAIIFQPFGDSEFFPLVVTTAVGLALFRVLLGAVEPPPAEPAEPAEPGEPQRAAPGIAAGVLAALAIGGLALFALPPPVSANNCSGWGDCPVTMEAVAAAGAGSAAIVALSAALAASRAAEPREKEKRNRRRRRKLAGTAPREPLIAGNLVERLRERALRNYFGPR